ncbi:flagellar hook-length control protein FliK [Pannonibacter tanglangensis]|uniref:Flagellar hook-length control protein-like C-terminal domain-containing protein n=1 Tax=Pannonibacter tanglangensis TaxID=2750084 RepID=A0ABW9ZH65_9HYPH|nr:flagellar hook-length control protein FliK [Pannonibacter sp. XCT-34]NBN63789.1 hypothetical protein [Pannonibacter sp. XCT-34]
MPSDPALLPRLGSQPALEQALSSVLALADGPETASLPAALQSFTATLRGFRMPAEAATDPAALRAAVELVAGLALPRGAGQPASGAPATAARADGLRSFLLTLAGLVADSQESAASAPARAGGAQAAPLAAAAGKPGRADPQSVGARLTPGEAVSLARLTGQEAQVQGTLARLARALDEALVQDLRRSHARGSGATEAGAGASSPSQAAARAADLTLDLPLYVGGETRLLTLSIGRDGGGAGEAGEGAAEWRVRFALALPATGPVEAAVSLRGKALAVVLRAEQPETVAAFQALSGTLQALLAEEGLELAGLQIQKTSAPRGQHADTRS